MAWSRTLGDLVSDVSDRADVAGFTTRHPTSTIRRRLIESYHALRDWMTTHGSNRWMAPYPIELDPALATPFDYGIRYSLVELTSGKVFEKPIKVEYYTSNKWLELQPATLGDVYNYTAQVINNPQIWIPLGFAGEPTSQANAYEQILICPTKTTAFRIRCWGVPNMVLPDADGYTLYLDGPGFDWLIWDTVIKITARDNDAQNTYQIAMAERAKIEEAIKANIRTEARAVPQRRDVFHGAVRRRGYYTRW